MTDVKVRSRPYHAPARQTRAAASRTRVLAEARAMFVTRGYAATSVEEIATAAGVGRRSIYDAFGSKRGVLFALLGELAPTQQARFRLALKDSAGDPEEQLRLAVGFVTELYERSADLLAMVHASAGADPDLAALDAEGERRRLAGQRSTVRDWHRRGLLRPDLSLTRAADILWALTSPSLYRLFVTERGWTNDAYRRWLHSELVHALLRRPDGG